MQSEKRDDKTDVGTYILLFVGLFNKTFYTFLKSNGTNYLPCLQAYVI